MRTSEKTGMSLYEILPRALPRKYGVHVTIDTSGVQVQAFLHPEAPYFELTPECDIDVLGRLSAILTDIRAGRIACFGVPAKKQLFTHSLAVGADQRLLQASATGPNRGNLYPYLVVGLPW